MSDADPKAILYLAVAFAFRRPYSPASALKRATEFVEAQCRQAREDFEREQRGEARRDTPKPQGVSIQEHFVAETLKALADFERHL